MSLFFPDYYPCDSVTVIGAAFITCSKVLINWGSSKISNWWDFKKARMKYKGVSDPYTHYEFPYRTYCRAFMHAVLPHMRVLFSKVVKNFSIFVCFMHFFPFSVLFCFFIKKMHPCNIPQFQLLMFTTSLKQQKF